MKKGRKNEAIGGLRLRPKLSLSDTISNTIMSEKIVVAVFWILVILLIIWLLSVLG